MKKVMQFFALILMASSLSLSTYALELSPLTSEPYTGDLAVIEKKKVIRVLVSADLGFYYIEDGQPKGIIAELLAHFEQQLKKEKRPLHIQIIPVTRDQLIPLLIDGYGDLIVANLTITATREKEVSFSNPVLDNISELIVTNKSHPPITEITQLSGQDFWVRKSSSYYRSLLRVNNQLELQQLAPINIHFIDETIQDYELIEMINVGLINATLLDSHKVKIWLSTMPNIQVNEQFPLRYKGEIGWAVRKDSPKFLALINNYIKTVKSGTLMGNVIYNKYLNQHLWLKKFLSPSKIDKAKELSNVFFKFSTEYDFDYLMMMAQGYQESGLEQNKVSYKGAVGIMQVLPSTARDKAVNISNIYNPTNNIHAGIKYMAYLRKYFFSDESIDYQNQVYLSLAAYNAGPGNISKMRRYAKEQGYNPNIWFKNVEVVTRKHIGKQPVVYVKNINRYFIMYKQLVVLKKERRGTVKPFHPPYKYNPISLF
ncbi:TPA: transglycosylase SLT domain-containing protein [Photobacterium damselae]